MKLIDYDAMFTQYMQQYLEEHKDEFADEDAIEAMLPDLYNEWLDEHKKDFDNENDAYELVDMINRYYEEGIPLPELLCDRIVELEDGAKALTNALRSDIYETEVQMVLINLLREIDSGLPLEWYLARIEESSEEDEIADNAAEAVDALVERFGERIKEAFLQSKNDNARFRLIDTVINMGSDERVYNYLTENLTRSDRAIFAAYLGKYGDERAVPLLQQELRNPKIDYIEYIELRNAIELLGAVPEIELSFDGEKYYEALKARREAKENG